MPTNPNDIIFSPQDIALLSVEDMERRRSACDGQTLGSGIPMYIRQDDQKKTVDLKDPNDIGFLAVLPTELITIIGRPGHGKTALMMRWARERAMDIRRRAALGDPDAARRIVVYATWEQTVEELNAFHVAASLSEKNRMSVTSMAMGKINDDQMDEIKGINLQRAADPLWIIGHSLKRRKTRPIISVPMFADALANIESWQGKDQFIIDSVFCDYLQRIPYGKVENKTIGVSDNLDGLKNIAGSTGAGFIVGVQSTRDVEKRDDPTPGMDDGQWTSNIEQTSDGVISVLRPCLYRAQTEDFCNVPVRGYQQMKLAFLKRKLGPANFERWISFDVKYNRLCENEIKHYDFSKDI